MRLPLPILLAACAAACSTGPPIEPKFERPIRVEATADGMLLVDGQAASWETLPEVLQGAVRSRGTAEGFRPSAVVRVGRGCPEETFTRLVEALFRVGVREILGGAEPG